MILPAYQNPLIRLRISTSGGVERPPFGGMTSDASTDRRKFAHHSPLEEDGFRTSSSARFRPR
jgi:hypothetical protein